MRNRTLFAAILALLVAGIVLMGALQPPSVHSALGRFAAAAYNGLVWFFTVAIPWTIFQVWVIVGFVLVWIGPALLARLVKRYINIGDQKVDPKHDFNLVERMVLWMTAAIFIGMLWLAAPNLLIVRGGWYSFLLGVFHLYDFERVHLTSAGWALVTSALWFLFSKEDGAPLDSGY